MEHRFADGNPAMTLEELERERLRTYLDWADVRAPVWFWPAYAVAIAAWIAGYEWGSLWGGAGALLVVAVTVAGLREMANRGQVSMPRFRGMPSRLKRAHLPFVAVALWLVGVVAFALPRETAPFVLLGLVTGPVMALGGAWTSRRYRIEAKRLAAEVGLPR